MMGNKGEVLRYLGYRQQQMTPQLDQLIDDCMAQCQQAARQLRVYRKFALQRRDDGIALSGTNLVLPGADIARHLQKADSCFVMAVTLGVEVDSLIRVAQATELTRAVILDACASDLVEQCCDELSAQLAQVAARDGLGTTSRFSPGYGDLPLSMQPQVLTLLNAQRQIGLTHTPDYLMIPRKSVTAIVGVVPKACGEESGGNRCDRCPDRATCPYGKRREA